MSCGQYRKVNFFRLNKERSYKINKYGNESVVTISLREKCPNTELFLVCIFLNSEWIRSRVNLCFSANTGKYGPEITPYLDTFHAVYLKK